VLARCAAAWSEVPGHAPSLAQTLFPPALLQQGTGALPAEEDYVRRYPYNNPYNKASHARLQQPGTLGLAFLS